MGLLAGLPQRRWAIVTLERSYDRYAVVDHEVAAFCCVRERSRGLLHARVIVLGLRNGIAEVPDRVFERYKAATTDGNGIVKAL